MTATATTATIASALQTTPRELRKFLRSQEQGVGKGSRYALPNDKRSLASMRKKFAAWEVEVAAKKPAKETASINDSGVNLDEPLDEVLDADMIAELEPTDMELLDEEVIDDEEFDDFGNLIIDQD